VRILARVSVDERLDRNIVSRYKPAMGKGLLQRDILVVLNKQRGWSRPKDILASLNREPTASNRVAISKALKRLWQRGLIDLATPEVHNVGKSNLYRARRRR
jgi:hypothetical protein